VAAPQRLRDRQAQATRELIVAVARERFTTNGYTGTSINEIAQQAGVAKGALYHHFKDKDALFRAVYDTVQGETVAAVLAAAAAETDPWASVRAGVSTFLDACLDLAFRRIVVLESVTVLQPEAWEGGAEPAELPMLRSVLTTLVDDHVLADVAVDSLAHVALGGLYGAALHIARAPDPAQARRDAEVVLDTLIHGLGGTHTPNPSR
jgi:AcrR family transcriptional regulator